MQDNLEFLIKLGQRVKVLREERGISQVLLCEMAAISRSQLTRLEKGDLNITMNTLVSLANAFEIDPKELL